MAKNKAKETITPTKKAKPQTIEDKILGKAPIMETEKKIDYENPSIKYKVTNLVVKNKPIVVNGSLIETFIGGKNLLARNELKKGAKEVITKDPYKKIDLYKIEVV